MKAPLYETPIERLKRLAREAKARQDGTAAKPLDQTEAEQKVIADNLAPLPAAIRNEFNGVELTERQALGVSYALQGTSFCMTGAAGTGKTTTTRNIVSALIQSNKIPQLTITHRYLSSGTPGIVGCAFTNKAVQNIKRVMPADLQHNFITIHKLLEFEPVYYEAYDEKKARMVTKMEFKPARHQFNPLPESLRVLILEESTMISVDLWNQLFDALPIGGNIQIILIGDIQQLPPVFGKSIFIHAMQAGIKVVELDKVHRQALDSPILELAHRVLAGKVIPSVQLEEWNKETTSGKLTIVPWKKELTPEMSVKKLGDYNKDANGNYKGFLIANAEAGNYDPFKDTILTPFNVNFGTQEINKYIATYLAQSDRWNPDGNLVHEVIGGVSTKYFRIGDKVLWNKTEHMVTNIKSNPKYYEKDPQIPSRTMDYWGHETDEHAQDVMMALLEGDTSSLSDEHNRKVDLLLASFQALSDGQEGEEKSGSRQCSHVITVESPEFGEYKIETSGDLAALDLAYAITVHKSQGSEYERVFFVTHKSQATMFFRELVYTAITRAKKELVMICPPSLLVQGITTQRLPGKTLEEKIAAFQRYVEVSKVSQTELPKGLGILIKEAA
ncbi:ATP-dependent RecD-like DNA helicase [compost metagenome]